MNEAKFIDCLALLSANGLHFDAVAKGAAALPENVAVLSAALRHPGFSIARTLELGRADFLFAAGRSNLLRDDDIVSMLAWSLRGGQVDTALASQIIREFSLAGGAEQPEQSGENTQAATPSPMQLLLTELAGRGNWASAPTLLQLADDLDKKTGALSPLRGDVARMVANNEMLSLRELARLPYFIAKCGFPNEENLPRIERLLREAQRRICERGGVAGVEGLVWLAENASLPRKTLEVLIFEVGAELPTRGAGPYPNNPLCYPRLAALLGGDEATDFRLASEAEVAKRSAGVAEEFERLLQRFVEVIRAYKARYNTFPYVGERLQLLVAYDVDEQQRSEWRQNEEERLSELTRRARSDAEMAQKMKTAWARERARMAEICRAHADGMGIHNSPQ